MTSLRHAAVPAVLLAAALSACEDQGVACTEEFRALTVTVTDTAGTAAVGADVHSTLQRTGEELGQTSLALLTPGTYVIVDDGFLDRLRAGGDSVIVTASLNAGPVTTGRYWITALCHVTRVSGPDTLVVH